MAVKNPEDIKAPVYKILDEQGFYGPDLILHKEGELLGWKGEPNFKMKPMNKLAKNEMEKYKAKITAEARKKAEKDGVEFTGLSPHITQHIDDGLEEYEDDENKQVFSLNDRVGGKAPVLPKLKGTDPRVILLSEKDPEKDLEVMHLDLKSA